MGINNPQEEKDAQDPSQRNRHRPGHLALRLRWWRQRRALDPSTSRSSDNAFGSDPGSRTRTRTGSRSCAYARADSRTDTNPHSGR